MGVNKKLMGWYPGGGGGGSTDRLTGGTPSGNGTVAKAVDDNVYTYWQYASVVPFYFQYDCGVGVVWAFAKLRAKNYIGYGINGFNIQLSNNGSDWVTVYTGNMLNNSDWQEFTWTNITTYRYIRLNVTSKYYAGGDFGVWELEAMEGVTVSGGKWIPIKVDSTGKIVLSA